MEISSINPYLKFETIEKIGWVPVIKPLNKDMRDRIEPTQKGYKVPQNRQKMIKFCIWSTTKLYMFNQVQNITLLYTFTPIGARGQFLMLPYFAKK